MRGLYHGSEKSLAHEKSLAVLKKLTAHIPVLPLPPDAGIQYGRIRAALEHNGQRIGNNDLWIAAHARTAGVTLVTNNEREFARVEELSVEKWVSPLGS